MICYCVHACVSLRLLVLVVAVLLPEVEAAFSLVTRQAPVRKTKTKKNRNHLGKIA